ncbi:MAG: hypothetical protein LBV34_19755 [Nocardiopsaceae bacterium]|jgi:hypothetical protein|nr:hypothetical protein [Nocardiopsaceae bacterium]
MAGQDPRDRTGGTIEDTRDRAPALLGWQYVPALAEAEAPPSRPASIAVDRFDPGWFAAQARISAIVSRPARVGAAALAMVALLLVGVSLARTSTGLPVVLGALMCSFGSAASVVSAWRGRRRLGAIVAGERRRVEAARALLVGRIEQRQQDYISRYRAWQRRKGVAARHAAWLPVELPHGINRIDVAGGSLASWAALITTMAVPRLVAGGEVTVIDLTEGGVATELIRIAEGAGLRSLVWVLPRDLPRLDLGAGLGGPALADVLTLAASAAGTQRAAAPPAEHAAGDIAADCALLERVLGVLGPDPGLASVNAALRVLADVGDPLADVRAGLLTNGQLAQIGTLFRRGAAERIVLERAFLLESRLRELDTLGSGQPPAHPDPTRLRVASLDRRAGVIGNQMIGAYLVAAATHMLRQAEPGEPWAHAICVLGAERLGDDVLDRLAGACEISSAGLMLAFSAIPPRVRERLGRGNAAIAFMRLGNGDDARAASELIGSEHRFVVAQLTDTIGTSLTDTWGGSYTSTAGTSDSVADSWSASTSSGSTRGRGRGRHGYGPFGDFNSSSSRDQSYSVGESHSASLTEGVNSGTSWGTSLSRALGENASLGWTAQRSRELLVEPDALQQLPLSAMIVSCPSAAGRRVLLADANPALAALAGPAA